ncbi:DUF2092 domain-containing protein [Arthrobacter sp. LAPM80]|uniref:LolA family protein n=1 Tax=Arthrobacter sp. LAPM80 TaxID=3141788 RepID=UPI00398AB8B0
MLAMNRRWVRWIPAVAMPAVVAAVVLAGPLQAQTPVTLSTKTGEQVLQMLAGSRVQALSGTLAQTVDLGLPQLPSVGPGSAPATGSGAAVDLGQLVEFLAEPHTARIYVDGAGNERLQVLDSMAERDIVRRDNIVWTYDSATNSATQLTLPTTPVLGPVSAAGPMEQTPAVMAANILKNLDPATTVSVGANVKVANQPAYNLQLVPKSADTLIAKVSIAVDANNGMPLRVTVLAKGQAKPAIEVGFSELTLAAPPASMFDFTPPPGATVTKQAVPNPAAGGPLQPGAAAPGTESKPVASKAATSGTGWSAIVQAPAGTVPADMLGAPALARVLQTVQGGSALSTSLFNVLITPSGAVYAGAVPLAVLQQAAAAK